MKFIVRNAMMTDYESVIKILDQVQLMHVEWRPDIYKQTEDIIPIEIFKKIVNENTLYVAETDGKVVGVLEILFRHIETPTHVTRDIVFIDSMAVDEAYEIFERLKKVYGFHNDGEEE